MKKEDFVSLSSWQPLNLGRPPEPAANVRNKACARCWVNFHFILMGAALQILWWKCVLTCSATAGAITVAISQEQLCSSLQLPLGDDLAVSHRNFLWSLSVTWVKSIGEMNAPCPSCLPTHPAQIWKIQRHVVSLVLNVISHKGIPSGETSLQMEFCVNSTFLSCFR